jgi:ABC-2 type transport system permease protein
MASAPPPRSRRGSPSGSFLRLYGLFIRHQLTWGRAAAVLALGGFCGLISLAIGFEAYDRVTDAVEWMNLFGFTAVVPICALVFASSAFGDTVDDRTLVYLWLTPVSRFRMAAAAVLASITIALPLVFIPLVGAAVVSRATGALVGATAVATIVGVIGYCGAFVALGLRFRRALVWGIAYILIWEGFVATASSTAAKLSLRAYTSSILSQYTGVGLRLGTLTLASAVVVPLLVCIGFTLLTARMLDKIDID